MHKLLIAAAAAATLSAPAAAQDPRYEDRVDEGIVRALPPPDDVEAMAPVLDRSVGAMMDVDVGPILDAADPWRWRDGYGRPGRTLRELGRRDDPYFEERIRSSIYTTTAGMARMMGAFSAAAPALAHSIREIERAMGAAIDDYHRRRGDPRDDWRDREPYPED